jgi:histidinol dehydrogenase
MPPDGPRRLDTREPGFARAFQGLVDELREEEEQVTAVVAAILARIRAGGDAALIEETRRFDRHDCRRLAFDAAEIAAGAGSCAPHALAALQLAA